MCDSNQKRCRVAHFIMGKNYFVAFYHPWVLSVEADWECFSDIVIPMLSTQQQNISCKYVCSIAVVAFIYFSAYIMCEVLKLLDSFLGFCIWKLSSYISSKSWLKNNWTCLDFSQTCLTGVSNNCWLVTLHN